MAKRRARIETGQARLAEVNARLQAALKLLDTDSADQIIGEPGPGYGELIQGVEAAMQLLWAGIQGGGAARSQRVLSYVAKTQIFLLQMVHFAYALGIQRGRENLTPPAGRGGE